MESHRIDLDEYVPMNMAANGIDALRKEAQRTREFVTKQAPRLNRKGQELKTDITDPDSAKMATSKGVIQGTRRRRR